MSGRVSYRTLVEDALNTYFNAYAYNLPVCICIQPNGTQFNGMLCICKWQDSDTISRTQAVFLLPGIVASKAILFKATYTIFEASFP